MKKKCRSELLQKYENSGSLQRRQDFCQKANNYGLQFLKNFKLAL
jgi:hypothetical protein